MGDKMKAELLAEIERLEKRDADLRARVTARQSLRELWAAGYKLSDLRAAGYTLSDLWAAGYKLSELRAAVETIEDE